MAKYLSPSNEFIATSLVNYMEHMKYKIDGNGGLITAYVEGANKNLEPNNDAPNKWNDRRIVIQWYGGKWNLLLNVDATTEPGKFYTDNPMNKKGAARIAFGQHTAWQFGFHQGYQEALVQVLPVWVHRDLNKDGSRNGDPVEFGVFGINQHSTKKGVMPSTVDRYSAGCLVGRILSEHKYFLNIMQQDYRYKKSKKHIFDAAVIDGTKLWQFIHSI